MAQLASALRSGRRGRVFESPLPDKNSSSKGCCFFYTGALPRAPRLPALVLLPMRVECVFDLRGKSTGLRRSPYGDLNLPGRCPELLSKTVFVPEGTVFTGGTAPCIPSCFARRFALRLLNLKTSGNTITVPTVTRKGTLFQPSQNGLGWNTDCPLNGLCLILMSPVFFGINEM